MTALIALVMLGQAPSPEAWRALLEIPISTEPVAIDMTSLAREQAASKLAALGPQLVRDRREPRILLRAAEWLEILGDPGAMDYAENARAALLELTRTPEQEVQLAEALVRLNRDAEAAEQIAKLPLGAVRSRWEGERLRRQVERLAQVEVVPRGVARWLPLSLASLRRPSEAAGWHSTLDQSIAALEAAVKLEPKDPVLHRLSADAMVARAYVESAERWIVERQTVSLIPLSAFIRFKESASLASEDPLAQAEAYEVRVLHETEQAGSDPSKWPTDAAKYLEGVRARLKSIAEGADALMARQAAEILALISVRERRLEEGLTWLEQASQPASERIGWVRFRVLLGVNKLAEAVAVGEAIPARDTLPELAMGLIAAYDRLGRTEARDAALIEARHASPTDLGLMLAQAVIELRKPDGSGLPTAVGLLSDAESRAAGDPLANEVRFARAVCYALLGDLPAARAALGKITELSGTRLAEAKKLAG